MNHGFTIPAPVFALGDIQARFDRVVREFEARCSDQGRLQSDDPCS